VVGLLRTLLCLLHWMMSRNQLILHPGAELGVNLFLYQDLPRWKRVTEAVGVVPVQIA
jgi:hypothetical protein